MLLSKAHLYTEADQMTSFYARAYTHPARLDIMRSLGKDGPQTVQHLAQFHPLTLSAVSQHLEILRYVEIVNFNPHHPYLEYYVDKEKFIEASNCLIQYVNELRLFL